MKDARYNQHGFSTECLAAEKSHSFILSHCHTPIPPFSHTSILSCCHSPIPQHMNLNSVALNKTTIQFHLPPLPFIPHTPIPPYPSTHVPALCLGDLTQVSDCQFGESGSQGSCYEELSLQKIASERGSGEYRETQYYSGTPLIQTPMGQKKVSILVRYPYFRG